MFPITFALLLNKNEATYIRFLSLLCNVALCYGVRFSLKVIQIDFEIAMINTISRVLINSEIHGCFFHYTQAIWRKVSNLRLTISFKNSPSVRKTVRQLSALPLVPYNNIDEVWDAIYENAPFEINNTRALLDYVIMTWIDKIYGLFHRRILCHFDNEVARTNNNLENGISN
jgi:hypothetical protein